MLLAGLLAREPLMMAAVVLGFQVLKGLSLAAIARSVGVSPGQRWLLAALLAQGGEFAFVVFGVARTARLLPGDWDARLTLAVALSMALTPVLLLLHERWLQRRASAAEREPDAIFLARGVARPLWIGKAPAALFFASTRRALAIVEAALGLQLETKQLRQGRLLEARAGEVVRRRRFRADRRHREEAPVSPVHSPHEAVSCLSRLAALASV